MEQTFGKENVVVVWFLWHFYEVPNFLFLVWKNYLAFSLNYFSVPLLFLTLFSPWKKYNWYYPRGFDIGEYFGTFISNIFSRIVGAICRLCLIIIGILAQIIIFVVGLCAIVLWFLVPVIFIFLVLLLLT